MSFESVHSFPAGMLPITGQQSFAERELANQSASIMPFSEGLANYESDALQELVSEAFEAAGEALLAAPGCSVKEDFSLAGFGESAGVASNSPPDEPVIDS